MSIIRKIILNLEKLLFLLKSWIVYVRVLINKCISSPQVVTFFFFFLIFMVNYGDSKDIGCKVWDSKTQNLALLQT